MNPDDATARRNQQSSRAKLVKLTGYKGNLLSILSIIAKISQSWVSVRSSMQKRADSTFLSGCCKKKCTWLRSRVSQEARVTLPPPSFIPGESPTGGWVTTLKRKRRDNRMTRHTFYPFIVARVVFAKRAHPRFPSLFSLGVKNTACRATEKPQSPNSS